MIETQQSPKVKTGEQTPPEDPLSLIFRFFSDPKFVKFESKQDSPSFFKVVGRTFTETWHSALLGWLFHPKGSHELGDYPLQRLILLLSSQDELNGKREIDIKQLLVRADFSAAMVRPNERDSKEVEVPEVDGRFDVFVETIFPKEGMSFGSWKEVKILIETKIKAPTDKKQCGRYITHIESEKLKGILTLPLFIAPTERFENEADSETMLGNASWIRADFKKIYLQIIEPCLKHDGLSTFGRGVLSEYVKTLKLPCMNEKPLITTEEDREMVMELRKQHAPAIDAFYAILHEETGEFGPLKSDDETTKKPLTIKIGGGPAIEAASIKKLYFEVLKFLFNGGYLNNVELPIKSGEKQFLLTKGEPKHPLGNEFWSKVGYESYWMEANKSRDQGLKDLKKVLEKCGLKLEVLS